MRREEQLAPTRAQRRVHRVLLDRLLEKRVRGPNVAGRSRGVAFDPRIGALGEQLLEARARFGARAAVREPSHATSAGARSSAYSIVTANAAGGSPSDSSDPRPAASRRLCTRYSFCASSILPCTSASWSSSAWSCSRYSSFGTRRGASAALRSSPRARSSARRAPRARASREPARTEPRDHETRGAVAFDLRMLGRERALSEAVLHLAGRVVERFLRGDHTILINVCRAVGERLGPVGREARRVALEAAARGRDQRPAVAGPASSVAPLALVVFTIELRARGHGREQLQELVPVDVGPRQVQLVCLAVVAAVADEDHGERVRRLRARLQRPEALFDRLARRALAREHRDASIAGRAARDGRELLDLLSNCS